MDLVKNEKDCTEFEAGDATLLKEILHPDNDKIPINFSLAKARIAKGGASLPHTLTSSETYYFLSGNGIIYINDKSKNVEQGTIVFVPGNARQFVENTGTKDLTFLCIVEPYWTEDCEVVD